MRFVSGLAILMAGIVMLSGGGVAAAHQTAELEKMVVTGTRTKHTLEDVPVETQVITRQDIERSPARNIADILKTVPGINTSMLDDVLGTDNLRATMRGLQFNEGYGLVLIDGQRAHGEMGAHGDYGISLNQIPLSMVERIEIVKGAASALYGADALAGVINIITRKAPKEFTAHVSGGGSQYEMTKRNGQSANSPFRDIYRASAGVGGPALANSGYYLNYSYDQDEGVAVDPAKTFRHSLQGRWNTAIIENLNLDLGANYSQARREMNNAPAKYDREYDSYRFSGALTYQLGDNREHEFVLSGYTYWQDFVHGYGGDSQTHRDGRVGYDQAELVYHWYTDTNILTIGASTQIQGLDYFADTYSKGKVTSKVNVDKNIVTNSVFIQNEFFFLDNKLSLVPGVRLEDHSEFGFEANPKFSAMFKATESTTLRGSVGRAFKSPTIRQLYYDGLMRHGSYYIQSNSDLEPETAISYSLNIEQNLFGDMVTFNIGYFNNQIKDMVVRGTTGEFAPDGLPIESYFNVDKASVHGVELSARLMLNESFSLNAGYNYTDSENKDTGKDLPYVPGYSLSLAPTYVYQPWNVGASVIMTHMGKQYRNAANTQTVNEHNIVDAKIWKSFEYGRVSLDAKNIGHSDCGDGEYAYRMGRSIGLNFEFEF